MRISQIAAQTGLTIDTIRYYERVGLCPPIHKGGDGVRAYTLENLGWLTLLASLRETGMPLKEMAEFARLYQAGDTTVAQRKVMLQAHATRLQDKHAALAKCEALLALKIERYDAILGETTCG